MLTNFLNAGYPVVAVATADDSQVIAELNATRAEIETRRTFIYSAGQSIRDALTREAIEQANWQQAFMFAAAERDRVLIVRDCNHVISNAPIYRALLDCCDALKANGCTIVLVAPNWQLPPELTHVVPIIEQPLPSREQLGEPLDVVAQSAAVELNGLRAELLDAAAGLTTSEAENAFALSLVETGSLDVATVQREKMRLIGSTGYLSVEKPVSADSIGGLEALKTYLESEVKPVCRDTQLAVRGILLAGIPGTGKSLSAKACAAVLNWPVVRLDVGACKGSLVGQSEANIRAATKLVEAIAPAVLWIDEIEKSIGGFKSSAQTDGGTTLGMLGHLLTWLQEHSSPIFTIATCNDYNALPPELTRAGRFDERFVVDLPTTSERQAIATVHLSRLGCSVELAQTIAQRTEHYTGAEIEQLVKSAARLSNRSIKLADIETAGKSIKPIATVKRDEIEAFRNWSRKALRLANNPESKPENKRRAALERN